MTVELEYRDAERLVRDLRRFAKQALPYAVRSALNTSAFEGRKLWVVQVEKSFTLRNKFTTRSLRVVKTSGRDPDRMESMLGSVADFMLTQEQGGVERGGPGRGKPIPTAVSAGQGMGTKPRTRPVRRPNWLSAIKLARGRRVKGTRKQRNAMALSIAARTGHRFVFLDLQNRRGLFRVTGRKKLTIRMLWDLSRPTVRIPPNPTLQRTLDALEPQLPKIHADAFVEQLKRNRVLGY